MNILKKKIDKILNTPVSGEDFHRNLRLIVLTIGLIGTCVVGGTIISNMITDIKEKTGYIQVEGKVIECTTASNNTIWSFIGIEDSTEYKTIIQVNNKILESHKKEIYYMCKDKENNSIDLEVGTYEDEANSIEKIIDSE
ncbi:hypothetical protein ACTFJW_15535 [Clostridium cagae]|uniref:hypothetical protein n=1 Tax=Clostridium cagae TaxID=2080751 RepID=UPI003F76B8BF